MSYRQSSYDPNAYEQPGRPLRPYNWVQWTGVGLVVLGITAFFAYFAGRAGLIPKWIEDPMPVVIFSAAGSLLVNSRREPGTQISPETRRKRLLIILAAAVVCGLAAAIILNSKGA